MVKSVLSDAAGRWDRAAWALALVATGLLLAAVLAPPLLPPVVRAPLVAGFHVLCHQLPERSFFFDGVQLAACHRCTGIYAGLVLGVLVPALWRPGVRGKRAEGLALLVAVVPAALDWTGEALGLWPGSAASRVATGLWFGAIAGFLFARAVAVRRVAG
ncbi:MAG TPA: DUF2085 domain-containing protein [Glycomyces sp.]|nr:DUF2085 domain-containing protein [Glycomyces sp.]